MLPLAPLLPATDVLQEGRGAATMSEWLLQKWCLGKMSAVEVLDGCRHANLDPLDLFGTHLSTMDSHNAHRGLMAAVKKHFPGDLCPLFWAKVPLWDDARKCQTIGDVPFCLPHEWLADVAQADPQSWAANTDELRTVLDGWMRSVKAPEGDQIVAPITMWGDSAPFHTGTDSVNLLLWGGANKEGRYWITVLPKSAFCRCGCNGHHTLDAVWHVVAWSMRCLLAGVYPSRDHAGHWLTDAWRVARSGQRLPVRGACVQFRGDWPWLSYCFSVNYSGNTFPCFLCSASKTDVMPFTDPALSADWRCTLCTHESWLKERFRTAEKISPIFSMPGFRLEFVMLDWMHMADLGASQVAVGNCMCEMFFALGGIVTRPEAALNTLATYMKATGQRLGIDFPFTRLRLKDIRLATGEPRLRSKAARCRACVRICTECLEEFFEVVSDHERKRLACMKFLVQMYDTLDGWHPSAHAALASDCRKHLTLFLELAMPFKDAPNGWLRWRWFPKHHMLLHLTGEQARRMGNPRSWWCYLDEGHIGQAARVCESVHSKTLAKSCMDKYLTLQKLRRAGV